MANDLQSLAHTRWNCKYHIVFAPKYRRMVFYGEKKTEIGKILRQLCEWKGVEIHEAEVCPDHIHMLVSIPPKVAVSGFMGYLKGKSSVLIYEKFGGTQIQVPESRILVPRILCRYRREEHKGNCRVHQASARRRSHGRADDDARESERQPVYG